MYLFWKLDEKIYSLKKFWWENDPIQILWGVTDELLLRKLSLEQILWGGGRVAKEALMIKWAKINFIEGHWRTLMKNDLKPSLKQILWGISKKLLLRKWSWINFMKMRKWSRTNFLMVGVSKRNPILTLFLFYSHLQNWAKRVRSHIWGHLNIEYVFFNKI